MVVELYTGKVPPVRHTLCAWVAKDIAERPHAPSGVAAFMSAHSKTPHISPSMVSSSGNGVVRGLRGQQLGFTSGRQATVATPCSAHQNRTCNGNQGHGNQGSMHSV